MPPVSLRLSVWAVQEPPSISLPSLPVSSLVSPSLRAHCSTVTMPAMLSDLPCSATTDPTSCLLHLCPHPFFLSVLLAELLSPMASLEGPSLHFLSLHSSTPWLLPHTSPWFHLP